MRRQVVIKNGKRYLVTAPSVVDPLLDGVGPGGPAGSLLMVSNDGLWYTINASGSIPLVGVLVNQTGSSYADYTLGVQHLLADDGHSYLVYISGSAPTATLVVSQSVYTGSGDPKPDLLLRSITDTNYYRMTLTNNAGTIEPFVNQSIISSSWLPW